jgi:hypothetical protein
MYCWSNWLRSRIPSLWLRCCLPLPFAEDTSPIPESVALFVVAQLAGVAPFHQADESDLRDRTPRRGFACQRKGAKSTTTGRRPSMAGNGTTMAGSIPVARASLRAQAHHTHGTNGTPHRVVCRLCLEVVRHIGHGFLTAIMPHPLGVTPAAGMRVPLAMNSEHRSGLGSWRSSDRCPPKRSLPNQGSLMWGRLRRRYPGLGKI